MEKYKGRSRSAFDSLSKGNKGELLKEIAPLVRLKETDEAAKRFDNDMYGILIANMEAMPGFKHTKKPLCDTAVLLEKKTSIPQSKEKLPTIQQIQTDALWAANDILLLWVEKHILFSFGIYITKRKSEECLV